MAMSDDDIYDAFIGLHSMAGAFFAMIAVLDPEIWNGFWYIPGHPGGKLFRKLGHLLHSRRIFWLGMPIRWIPGFKDYLKEREDADK